MLNKKVTDSNNDTCLIYHHETPIGWAVIKESNGYIVSVALTETEATQNTEPGKATLITMRQLDEYFAGKRITFDLPLKPKGTLFQQTVWQQLLTIPFGRVISYAQQARQIGNPLAIRAIAAANGRNKLWIIVPCHRVIGTGGNLTGYAGGLWRKKWLLEHEAKISGLGQTQIGF